MAKKPEPPPIIYDTGEQRRPDLLYRLAERGEITLIRGVLNAGDYSLVGHKDGLFIETKWTMNDLASSMSGKGGKGRKRLKVEFERAWAHKKKYLITVGSLNDMRSGNYRADFHPHSFESTFWQWQQKFDFVPIFVKDHTEGQEQIVICCAQYLRFIERGLIDYEPQPWRYLFDSGRWVCKLWPGAYDKERRRVKRGGEVKTISPAEEFGDAVMQLGVAVKALTGRRGTK